MPNDEELDIIRTEEQRKWYDKGRQDNLEDLAFFYGMAIGGTIVLVIMLIIFNPLVI
jgi:hypothetical protein